MGVIDFFWHLVNLLAVSALFGTVAAVGARLLWRTQLAGVSVLRLMLLLQGAAAAVTLGGLVVFGRDGRMATYGAMVLAGALALGWVVRRRRL